MKSFDPQEKIKAKVGVWASQLKYLKHLETEAKQLSKEQKLYKLQSEFHRLMYTKTLEIETLKKLMFPNKD